MTFEEKVLLDFGMLEDGSGADTIYSGEEEKYNAYKKAVKQLSDDGYIQNATIFENPKTHEIEIASLKRAILTKQGIAKIEFLKQ